MSIKNLHIIPSPKKIEDLGDGYFAFSSVYTDCSEQKNQLSTLSYFAEKLHGVKLCEAEGGLTLKVNAELKDGEYILTVTEDGAIIEASCGDGFAYGCATVMQIAEKKSGKLSLPFLKISDKPDCNYRTLMVDLARKWHPFETLLKYADLCYLYKIKFLHLHFMDTQSYTLPSEAFPKMPTQDRHYTREQIALLNEYTKERNIEIIPEFEVPGHARAMVTAYPELFADIPIGTEKIDDYALFFADIKQNIICIGKEGIMDTLRTLTEEIISMFPDSRYLHIGGDEANIGEWANCRECTRYMREHGIDGPKPLYTHFIKKMTDMVLGMGKTPIVWEGFPRVGNEEISRDVIVTAWESYYYLAPEMIEDGFTITNASWEPLYTVPKGHRVVADGRWYPDDIMDWNIYTWKNWNKKTAAYEKPIVIEPTNQVIGSTFCAWENDYDGEIQTVKENLAAMSEKTWNINSKLTKEELRANLEKILVLADKLT